MKFTWDWCDICDVAFIKCPKCGNNTCSGGYGEIDGIKCDICPMCYQYEELAFANDSEPKNKEELSWINNLINNISS